VTLPRLYVILDAEVAGRIGWSVSDLAAACLAGGARLLQIRAKHLSGAEFLRASEQVVERAGRAGAIVLVNDRADIARLSGAGGVHVGQDDLAPAAVRALVGAESIVGLSTHVESQLEAACGEPIDYVAIGPVFPTATKAAAYEAGGLDMVRRAAHTIRSSGLPLVAIGGITLESAADVIDAGATSVAVISDIVSTGDDPEARVRAFVRCMMTV
jgi:thiamine-phosphate pyrophosphorylase